MIKKIFIFAFVSLFFVNFVLAQGEAKKEQEYIGEFFGAPVPIGNYYFVKGVIMVFGNTSGPKPQTPQELEDCVWNDLVLSYEAFRRNIEVSKDEVDEEITKMLKNEKVEFDWKKDGQAYVKWLKDKINEPTELFENQIRHLIQLQKVRKAIMDGIQPQVTDEEAYQEFLNEYNTLSVELVQFDQQKDAEEFYNKVKDGLKFWEQEKDKRPGDFKKPGFVSLEFLMDLWGFPKDAAYKMMQMEIDSIHPASPIYKGYGVFMVLEKRVADESRYPQLKESYYEQIKAKKRYEGLKEWVKKLKQEANIKIYPIKKEG